VPPSLTGPRRGEDDVGPEFTTLVGGVGGRDEEADSTEEGISAGDDFGFVGSNRELDKSEVLNELPIFPDREVTGTFKGVSRRCEADVVDEDAVNQPLRLSS
jgi:hypothetical protein